MWVLLFQTLLYYWYWQSGSKDGRWKDQSNTSERRDRSAGSVVGAVVGVVDITNLQLVTLATGIHLLSWIYPLTLIFRKVLQ